MKPLIKYPGGKEKEMHIIKNYLPPVINNYYEPFVGGGAILWGLNLGNGKYINDISEDLILFYRCVQTRNKSFYKELNYWNDELKKASVQAATHMREYYNAYYAEEDVTIPDLVTKQIVLDKFKHVRKKAEKSGSVEKLDDNIIAAFKQAVYVKARQKYNTYRRKNGVRAALYVIIRQYAFSGMFRFNQAGEFNIPYGGVPYNNKYLDEKIDIMRSRLVGQIMRNTTLGNMDFLTFMTTYPPGNNDFIFLDPPYDTTFSAYDNNDFNRNDQQRLANYLINTCAANWMVVIKATDYIRSLYPANTVCLNGNVISIREFDKRYDVCMKGRNEQHCEHLIITNY